MLGPYFTEAVQTLTASRWTLLKAKLFGRKEQHTDTGVTVTLYRYKGKMYLTNFTEE